MSLNAKTSNKMYVELTSAASLPDVFLKTNKQYNFLRLRLICCVCMLHLLLEGRFPRHLRLVGCCVTLAKADHDKSMFVVTNAYSNWPTFTPTFHRLWWLSDSYWVQWKPSFPWGPGDGRSVLQSSLIGQIIDVSLASYWQMNGLAKSGRSSSG